MRDRSIIEQLNDNFARLNIKPTISEKEIKKAFNVLALEMHPDKVQDTDQNSNCHNNFIELLKARDFCLAAIKNDEIIRFLSNEFKGTDNKNGSQSSETNNDSNDKYYKNIFTTSTTEEEYENEWEIFVNNKNAYSNIITKSCGGFLNALTVLGFSIAICLISSGLIGVMIGLLISIVMVLFTSAVIPVIGWFQAIFFIVSFPMLLSRLFSKAPKLIIKIVAETGSPLRTFIGGWIGINIILLSFVCISAGIIDYIFMTIFVVGIIIVLFKSKDDESISEIVELANILESKSNDLKYKRSHKRKVSWKESWDYIKGCFALFFQLVFSLPSGSTAILIVGFIVYFIVLDSFEKPIVAAVLMAINMLVNIGYVFGYRLIKGQLNEISEAFNNLRKTIKNVALIEYKP